jgi:hypothetical protein
MDLESEAELGGKVEEFSDASLGVVAEAEVTAFVKAEQAEGVVEDGADKFAGREAGQRRIEGQYEHGVDAGEREQAKAFVERREQSRGLGGPEELFWMWLEGDGDGASSKGAGIGSGGREDLPVAEVDSVEVADGGDGGAKAGGDLLDGMKNRGLVA